MAKGDDPFEMFGKMLSQWETMSNEMANKVMGTSEYGRAMGAATGAGVRMREAIHEAMTKVLETSNMPSREDVTELARAVAAIDARLQRIEAALAKLAGDAPRTRAVKRPPRTRKPPAKAK
jgi:hypothetical protein